MALNSLEWYSAELDNRIPVQDAQARLPEIADRVLNDRERIVLQLAGQGAVAIVPIEDLQVLETIEDRFDLAEARKALAESDGTVTWEELQKELAQ